MQKNQFKTTVADRRFTMFIDKLMPNETTPDTTGWKGRHIRAAKTHPVALMISALDTYQKRHAERFESPIAEDGVLGPAFLNMLQGARMLLNGETGALDCDVCDGALCAIAREAGFKEL